MGKRNQAVRPSEYLAKRLQELRIQYGLSQREVADRMTALGLPLHQTAIAKIERQGRAVSLEELWAMALIYNVSPSALVTPDADVEVAVAPRETRNGWAVRNWLAGQEPIGGVDAATRDDDSFHRNGGDEHYMRWQANRHPGVRAAQIVADDLRQWAMHGAEAMDPELLADQLRRHLQAATRYAELVLDEIEEHTQSRRKKAGD